ncbi:MAG TPA: restriction endonuclease subunit S, partial [Pyrinomonadaceae bacterium]|nr:restriction endonuclease subunit S [Pyrinomonadaceae bacterium]
VSLSLIVLDKEEKSDSILFIDTASEHFHEKRKGNEGLGLGKNKLVNVDEILQIFEQNLDGTYSRLVSRDECAENDYNLLPQRYVLRGEGPQLDNILKDTKVQLEELVEFIRPQTLKDYIADEGEDCFEVSVGDIGADGIIQTPKKIIYLSAKADSRVYQQKLSPADVLLAIKGSTGRVGFVPEDLRDTWFANQSFLVLRMRYNKYFENSIVLFRYLTSPIGQALLQRLVGGTTVPMLQTKDIKALPVVVPPTEEQNTIVEDHQKIVSIYREIAELEAEAEAIGKKHWKLD